MLEIRRRTTPSSRGDVASNGPPGHRELPDLGEQPASTSSSSPTTPERAPSWAVRLPPRRAAVRRPEPRDPSAALRGSAADLVAGLRRCQRTGDHAYLPTDEQEALVARAVAAEIGERTLRRQLAISEEACAISFSARMGNRRHRRAALRSRPDGRRRRDDPRTRSRRSNGRLRRGRERHGRTSEQRHRGPPAPTVATDPPRSSGPSDARQHPNQGEIAVSRDQISRVERPDSVSRRGSPNVCRCRAACCGGALSWGPGQGRRGVGVEPPGGRTWPRRPPAACPCCRRVEFARSAARQRHSAGERGSTRHPESSRSTPTGRSYRSSPS